MRGQNDQIEKVNTRVSHKFIYMNAIISHIHCRGKIDQTIFTRIDTFRNDQQNYSVGRKIRIHAKS